MLELPIVNRGVVEGSQVFVDLGRLQTSLAPVSLHLP